MKHLFLSLILCLSMAVHAENLGIVFFSSPQEIHNLIVDNDVTVNFYNDDFAIVTYSKTSQISLNLLTDNAWQDGHSYYIVYLGNNRDAYLDEISATTKILYQNDNFAIVESDESRFGQLKPAKNDGIVHLNPSGVKLPKTGRLNLNISDEPEQYIVDFLNQVSGENITATVQHLQDYGSRDTRGNGAVQAQQWIEEQFEALGLSVETQHVPMGWGSSAADNVIATKLGTTYPDEYVVIGCHLDSYVSSGNSAPGADDNASGVGGVLEIARILSQHDFARTLIFCTFAAEEYGLYGSAAYASRCAQQNMDILAYLNIDMSGYLTPGDTPHTSIIRPASASELSDYYRKTCSIYLPDFGTELGSLTGGDSDHTSFNQNGYMGIYPFEDANDYSPYIHTPNDLVGVSYMNEDQAVMFTKAILANMVSIADQVVWPKNLEAVAGNTIIELSWDELPEIKQFNIYRDDEFIATVTEPSYRDENLQNFVQYQYYVTSVSSEGKESKASNLASATPVTPISLPLLLDFENGDYYWIFTGSWGITSKQAHTGTHSLADSPDGGYGNNVNSTATLNTLDLSSTSYDNLYLSFYHERALSKDDVLYLEYSLDGENWDILDTYTMNQSPWKEYVYDLTQFIGNEQFILRFHFISNASGVSVGCYFDDFKIDEMNSIEENIIGANIYPNPANDYVKIDGDIDNIKIYNTLGQIIKTTDKNIIDVSSFNNGIYLFNITMRNGKVETRRIVVK